MFPPFPQELAHHYCLDLIAKIKSGQICLTRTGRLSLERADSGVMLGCAVCWDKKLAKRVILYTVSGNNREIQLQNYDEKNQFNGIIVPSIVSSIQIDKALAENDGEIHHLTDLINNHENKNDDEVKQLIKKRTLLTDHSLQKVFDLYTFTRFDGKSVSLNQIIKNHYGKLPPTGTGDCCAPKLLSYAFSKGYQIVSMDEIYFGRDTKNKIDGQSYEPCNERCGYILGEILGLNIIYRDNNIVVVDKQSGLLSVPGKGPEKADCVEARARVLFPDMILQNAVHRLDMETSGILILSRNKETHRKLEMQFASQNEDRIHKTYIAYLDGVLHGKTEGRIELKTRLDVENRPHQIIDNIDGKTGITLWKKLGVEKWKNPVTGEEKLLTKIEFKPLTGRTHQLRMAASVSVDKGGLGLPIVGDTLYGNCSEGESLMLRAVEVVVPGFGKFNV